MSKFIELPTDKGDVLINVENMIYIQADKDKTDIRFCVRGSNNYPKLITVNLDYQTVKNKLLEL